MKRLLAIILSAAALVASPAVGQTIKSLGYNTTNGRVIYSNTNPITFTNPVNFGFPNLASPAFGVPVEIYGTLNINAADLDGSGGESPPSLTVGAFTATGYTGTNTVTINTVSGISFGGDAAGLTRTNLGLGANDNVVFNELEINGAGLFVDESAFFSLSINTNFGGINLLNGITPMLSVTGTSATFSTNVTINGNLSVGSFTTTTPSTWALDATETAADTNGVLALPSNANVLRITNDNTIGAVSGGVLGAFYFLVNQSGTNVVISNSATITARGATNLTLGAGESATLITTTATNASAH